MRFLARTFLLLLFTLPILAIVVVWLCFQDTPSVVRSVQFTPQDIENARRVVARHDPRKVDYGGPRTVVISEQELDLMLNYAASRFGRGGARAELGPGTVWLQASAEIPKARSVVMSTSTPRCAKPKHCRVSIIFRSAG